MKLSFKSLKTQLTTPGPQGTEPTFPMYTTRIHAVTQNMLTFSKPPLQTVTMPCFPLETLVFTAMFLLRSRVPERKRKRMRQSFQNHTSMIYPDTLRLCFLNHSTQAFPAIMLMQIILTIPRYFWICTLLHNVIAKY